MSMDQDTARFVLRVLDLARGEWTRPDDTPEMERAAKAIKERYSQLKVSMNWDAAAMAARIEFLTNLGEFIDETNEKLPV